LYSSLVWLESRQFSQEQVDILIAALIDGTAATVAVVVAERSKGEA
jgi:hypothetical protein